jgi:hypothetical protein
MYYNIICINGLNKIKENKRGKRREPGNVHAARLRNRFFVAPRNKGSGAYFGGTKSIA